jgi:hypothetical protein
MEGGDPVPILAREETTGQTSRVCRNSLCYAKSRRWRLFSARAKVKMSEMGDTPVNKGPHDIGGEAAGPVDTTDHGMKFWEKQANALRSVLSRSGVVKVDELRRAAEGLGDEYRKLAYFEVTTSALRVLLLEKGLITESELQSRMAEIRRRFDVPDEMESPLKQKGKR